MHARGQMTKLSADTRRGSLTRLLAIFGLASVLGLAAAVPALAQDPTSAQYNSAVNQVQGEVGGGGPSSPAPAQRASGLQENVVGGLPFTGLDLLALVAVALALASIGFALRRMTTPGPR